MYTENGRALLRAGFSRRAWGVAVQGAGRVVEASRRGRRQARRADGVEKRATRPSGRPAERPPPAERRDRPVRHATQGLLERPRDAEEFGIIKSVEQHATWNHGPREHYTGGKRDRWDGNSFRWKSQWYSFVNAFAA